ncbi:MAG: type II secretion system protein [Deltaproteobacteria bacterium]|nr:type II secretion system protein [Deltaproteobacteria bacterium]
MKKDFININNHRGFTLIEIIVAMTIMGLLVLLGSFGLQSAVDGYTLARDNAHLSQKAQAALDRMAIEFASITFNGAQSRYNIITGNNSSLTYTANFGGADENHTIALGGSQVQLDNIPLTDIVGAFQLTYMNSNGAVVGGAVDPAVRIIGVSLTLNGPNGITRIFNTRVALQR